MTGFNCGRIQWPGSKKTVEGTLAFIIAVAGVFHLFFGLNAPILITTILCGILEGVLNENDNLYIPIYFIIMYQLLVHL